MKEKQVLAIAIVALGAGVLFPALTIYESPPETHTPVSHGSLKCIESKNPPDDIINYASLSPPCKEIFEKKVEYHYDEVVANSSQKDYFDGRWIRYWNDSYICAILHAP